jgi:hypothetical protein
LKVDPWRQFFEIRKTHCKTQVFPELGVSLLHLVTPNHAGFFGTLKCALSRRFFCVFGGVPAPPLVQPDPLRS